MHQPPNPGPLPFELTRQHLQDPPHPHVTWTHLAAPSGYGKTTVIAQLVRQHPRVVWLTLKEDLEDASTLQVALQGHLEASGPAWTERLTGTCLVLDRTEHLQSSAWHFVQSLLDLNLAGFQLFTAGFEVPPVGFRARVAAGQARLLDQEDLRFQPDESLEVLKARDFRGNPLEVHRHLQGWPLGVALVAAGARPSLDPTELLVELLQPLPGELKGLLPRACVLSLWSEQAARELPLGLPEGWLSLVLRAGLPLAPQGRGLYRPHALLLQVLENQLALQADVFQHLHGCAARRAEAQGDLFEAARHHVKAGSLQEAIRLAGILAPQYASRQRYTALWSLLEPMKDLGLPPELALLLAKTLGALHQVEQAAVHFQRLMHNEDRDIQVGAYTGLATLKVNQMQLQEAAALAELAHQQARQPGQRRRALHILATSLSHLGRGGEVLETMEREIKLARAESPGMELVPLLEGYAALQYHRSLPRAIAAMEEAIELCKVHGVHGARLNLTVGLVHFYVLSQQGKKALLWIEDLTREAEHLSPLAWAYLHLHRTEAHLTLGEHTPALKHGQDTLQLTQENESLKHVHLRTQITLAEVHLRMGNHELASVTLDNVLPGLTHAPEARGLQGKVQQIQAQILWQQGKIEALDRLRNLAAQPTTEIDITVPLYHAAAQTRWAEPRRQDVDLLVAALDHLGQDTPLEQHAPFLQDTYQQWVSLGWHPHRFLPHLQGDRLHLTVPHTHELRIMDLGEFQVTFNHQPLTLKSLKAQELLLWLAWHGASTPQEILRALWGEWGPAERKHLHVLVSAVRQAFRTCSTEVNPIHYDGTTYRLPEAFDVQVESRTLLSEQHQPDVDGYTHWVSRTDYRVLPISQSPWLEDLRQQVHLVGVDIILKLAETLRKEQPARALMAFQRAVALDPTLEEAHLGVIELLRFLGEEEAALLAQRRYERMLREDLHVEFPEGP